MLRSDYLAGKCSHRDYYLSIASELHLRPAQDMLRRVRQSRDPHLNDIPLREWDGLAAGVLTYNQKGVRDAFKRRGDYATKAGMVSLLKAFYLEEATKS